MAVQRGTNATLINQAIPQLVEAVDGKGRLHVIYDEYVVGATTPPTGDTILLGSFIPAGARVMDVIADAPDMDSGSNAVFTIGWAASADAVEAASAAGFIDSTTWNVQSATTKNMALIVQGTVGGKFKKFSSPVQCQITVSTAGTATTGTIKVAIYYSYV